MSKVDKIRKKLIATMNSEQLLLLKDYIEEYHKELMVILRKRYNKARSKK